MKSIHGQGRAGAKALRWKAAWCAGVNTQEVSVSGAE